MARMRARLARSVIDRDLHREIAMAVRHVSRALDVCVRVGRLRDPAMQAEARRAQNAQHTLQQVRSLLDQVGCLTPGYDREDPDLVPEAVRDIESERQRQTEREERRVKRAAQKKAAQKKRVSPEQRVRDSLEKMRDQDGPE